MDGEQITGGFRGRFQAMNSKMSCCNLCPSEIVDVSVGAEVEQTIILGACSVNVNI